MSKPRQPSESEWTQVERGALRGFLRQHPNLLQVLTMHCPEITGDTLEHRAMTASEHKGAEDIIAALRELAAPTPDIKTPSAYSDFSKDT